MGSPDRPGPASAPGRDLDVFQRGGARRRPSRPGGGTSRRNPAVLAAVVVAGVVGLAIAATLALGRSGDGGGTGSQPQWELIATAPVGGRFSPATVWTGSEMVLWGGGSCSGDRCTSAVATPLSDGAAYEPATDTWRVLAQAPLGARLRAGAAWTGSTLVVWGGNAGEDALDDGAVYDPAGDSWAEMAPAPLSGRYRPAAVWTGSEVVVWGGARGGESPEEVFADGAAYDPASDTWRSIAEAPLTARTAGSALWTGSEMVVWGGGGVGESFADGAAYDPEADTWRVLAEAPLGARSPGSAVWTGQEIVYWGGGTSADSFDEGAAYDPMSDTWRAMARGPLLPRRAFVSAWTGDEVVIWGGGPDNSLVFFGSGAAYDPVSDTWRDIPAWRARFAPAGVWTGDELITWSGIFAPSTIEILDDGARLDL